MAKTRKTKRSAAEPWDRPTPAGRKKALTPAHKAAAKKAARKAGRPYPNLVDNMREAAKQRPDRTRSTAKRAPAKRATAKRATAKRATAKRVAKKR